MFKYCFAWLLAEAGFAFAGLGFEGWERVGPPLDQREDSSTSDGEKEAYRPKW